MMAEERPVFVAATPAATSGVVARFLFDPDALDAACGCERSGSLFASGGGVEGEADACAGGGESDEDGVGGNGCPPSGVGVVLKVQPPG